MRWQLVSSKSDPMRWSKPCGLVQLYVQDHPLEEVKRMRFSAEVIINGARFAKTFHRSSQAAKNHATQRARVVLEDTLKHIMAKPPKKWMGP